MKTKLLSIVMLLIVVLSFSGVASAATQQVLVKEAWDEQVLVKEGYNITHPATYKTVVDVPEHTITVIDKKAWTETIPATYKTVVDVPGHYDKVEAEHNGWTLSSGDSIQKLGNKHKNAKDYKGQVINGYISVKHALCWGQDWKWDVVFDDVWVPTTYKTVVDVPEHTIEHPAVTHEEVIPATYKDVIDKDAWTETIPPVYETVHHAAEYITVEVIDPVVKKVTPAAEPKTVDMEETGTDFTLLYIAFGALVVGLGLVVLRRRE